MNDSIDYQVEIKRMKEERKQGVQKIYLVPDACMYNFAIGMLQGVCQ
jgi:hypothetical protein